MMTRQGVYSGRYQRRLRLRLWRVGCGSEMGLCAHLFNGPQSRTQHAHLLEGRIALLRTDCEQHIEAARDLHLQARVLVDQGRGNEGR
jgi:hypothetical protein